MRSMGLVKRTLAVGLMLTAGVTAMWGDQDKTTTAWTDLSTKTSGSTVGYTITGGTYYLTKDLTFSNSNAGGHGLTISGTVKIYIPAGVTLTCTGGAASGKDKGGGAGIYLPSGANLYFYGGGTVKATGGKAANGGGGGNGAKGTVSNTSSGTNIPGGKGGDGGAGGGAGIGTSGGTGGGGGNGGYCSATSNGLMLAASAGKAGTKGNDATKTMGELYRESEITIIAAGGTKGTDGSKGDNGDKKSLYYGGEGGYGGKGGLAGAQIGSGGGGGAGGNGGSSGYLTNNGPHANPVASASNGAAAIENTSYTTNQAALTGTISFTGSDQEASFNVSSSTNYTINTTVAGYSWQIDQWGLPCAATGNTTFTSSSDDTYAGGSTLTLKNVYGNLIFKQVPNTHTVTVDVATKSGTDADVSGTSNSVAIMSGTTTITNGEKASYNDNVSLTAKEATGYHFVSYASSDVTISSDNTFTMPDKDVTVTATFKENAYTIKYDVNGGTGTFADQVKYHNTNLTLSSTEPTRKAAKFLGWAKTQTATTAEFEAGKSYGNDLNGSKKDETVTLYAVWELFDYHVSVTPNAKGTVDLEDEYNNKASNNETLTTHYDFSVTVTAKPKEGYHIDLSQTQTATELLALSPAQTPTSSDVSKAKVTLTFKMPDQDVTVTAPPFSENSYAVAYNANGGTGAPESQTKQHFASLKLRPGKPTSDGRTFLGWATSSSATTADYQPGATVGTEFNPPHDGNTSTDGTTITLYAVWKATAYTVTIDPGINGGAVSADKVSATTGATVTLAYTPYEGYSDVQLYYYYIGDATKKTYPITGKSFTMPSHDVVVFATFKGSYTVDKDPLKVQELNNSQRIEHGTISVGGESIETLNTLSEADRPTVGAVLNTVAKPDKDWRLDKITWQRVSHGGMKARTRAASDTDVEVEGVHELQYNGTDPVSYDRQLGEYVAQITGLSGDVYLAGSFKEKEELPLASVTMEGPGDQEWTGVAIEPDRDTYIVRFDGEVQTDYTIAWSNNVEVGAKAVATITAGQYHEKYKGSVTLADRFEILKAPAGTYITDFTADFTYDGTEKKLDDLKVYREVDGEKTLMTSGYSVTYQNNKSAGTATAKIQIEGEDGGTLIRTFVIKPKPVTVTAEDQTTAYGTPVETTGTKATASGLVDGDQLAETTFVQTATEVGTHPNAIEVSGAKIKNTSGDDVTSNYDITYQPGTLTVNKKAITLTPTARTLEYGDPVPADMIAATWYTVDGLAYGEHLGTGEVPTGYTLKKDGSEVELTQGTPAGTYDLIFTGPSTTTDYDITTSPARWSSPPMTSARPPSNWRTASSPTTAPPRPPR